MAWCLIGQKIKPSTLQSRAQNDRLLMCQLFRIHLRLYYTQKNICRLNAGSRLQNWDDSVLSIIDNLGMLLIKLYVKHLAQEAAQPGFIL